MEESNGKKSNAREKSKGGPGKEPREAALGTVERTSEPMGEMAKRAQAFQQPMSPHAAS